jgi:transcriptional regulator with XRE-family HTH domain
MVTTALIDVCLPMIRANRLLADNIAALLRLRGYKQRDLAQWCRKSDVWVSLILSNKREVQFRDLDRIADFFGVATYQLLQPGVAQATERRHGERRAGFDRRVSHQTRLARDLEGRLRPPSFQKGADGSPPPHPLRQVLVEFERRVSRLLSEAESRGQIAPIGTEEPARRARRRVAGGSDVEKP